MSNFGDNLRNYIDTEWKSDDEKAMKIFDKEWKKATKKLVESTPEGKIRFALVSRRKIMMKLAINPFFSKTKHFMRNAITKASCSKPFFSTCPSEIYFPSLTYPDGQYTDPIMLVFYANNIEDYPNVGRDLIGFWFETQILPDFEREIKGRKADYRVTAQNELTYYYSEIKAVLDHFDIALTENDYKEIFTHLCDKNGIKLKKFSYPTPDKCAHSFELSL